MENKLQPKIRFKRYIDSWMQRKIRDLSEETLGGGTPKTSVKEFWDGEIAWIQSSDLKEHKISGVIPKKKITKLALKESAAKLIPKNSIAVVTRVGVGKVAVMDSEYATSQDFVSLTELKVDKWFAGYSLYQKLQKELLSVQGTSIKGITKNYLLDKTIHIPLKMDEQNEIGVFFKNLDGTISLHQQELETLKQTKQGFLQKMFPKEGETVPEIRFSGFSDQWKKHKLIDITNVFSDGDWIEAKDQSKDGIRLIQTGNIGVVRFLDKTRNAKWISEDTFNKLKCNEVFPGDILISRLPSPAGRACVLPNIDTRMITAVDCTIIRLKENFSTDFLIQLLSTSLYFNKVESFLGGGTRQRISKSTLGSIEFHIPSDYSEQKKIGDFFKEIDQTIELQEKELEALKETKKAFLQKMFV